MIIKPYRGKYPALHPMTRGAENAVVIGDVACGKDVNLWYNVTLRGDSSYIRVGEYTNIQDGAVLHCDGDAPLTIGKCCTIGHGAIVHGCTVGDGTLIGMAAVLLSGCEVGRNCLIGAGALVTGSMKIPDSSLVVGVPAKIVRLLSDRELAHNRENYLEYLELAAEELETAEAVQKI